MATTTQVLAGAKALQKHDFSRLKWNGISAGTQELYLEQSRVVLEAAEKIEEQSNV